MITKEIGGYFGLEEFYGREYHDGLIAVNNGRNALLYILKAKKIKKIYLPYFLCDSVRQMCEREGYSYGLYNISSDFMPLFDGKLDADEYLYVVNYYGQISNEQICTLKRKYKNIIFDNVQAFFQKPVSGIDTVYSCRKFFGVPDGGYLATDVLLDEEMALDVSKDRMKHILGRFEGAASDYYADFKENDSSFNNCTLRKMSVLTQNILKAVDYESVRRKRNENFAMLEKHLGEYNGLRFTTPDGPYCYPFYCKNGMRIKKALAAQKIYVATLWPNVLELSGTLEKDYAENILPLPCDQRYDAEDMERIAQYVCAELSDE
ncbi:MAG: hypothetical protein IJ017_02265 [Oscillospiraceae bacterium]|nr:hypothetical protein [Oscillospiraceae bacterium]